MKTINTFRGNYQFLSNFYSANVTYNGLTYSNNEAAFQAQKVSTDAERMPFVGMKPGEARSYGRKVKLRSDWENVKLNVMYNIVLAKFVQNSNLKEALLATGDAELVEGNTWNDRYWGVCNGSGSNHLGQILMTVRKELKEENIMNNNTNATVNNNTTTSKEEIIMKNNNQNVTTTIKEETIMTNQNNAAANNMIIAMSKEEVSMKTKNEIKVMLEAVGEKISNNEFKKTKKAELIAKLEKYLDPTKKVEIVEKKEETVMTDKMKQYLDSKWDKLVKAVAKEYVDQSLNTSFGLFFKNTKAITTKAEYLVKSSKLWGATSKVIKELYGEKNCNEDTIRQTLNAMVVRGYLNYQKVQGEKGVNVIFNATAAQMNAMYQLSR